MPTCIRILAPAVALVLGAYGCGVGPGGGPEEDPSFKLGDEPRIEITESGVNANGDDFTLKVSLTGFCHPDLDPECDLDAPSNNEKVGATLQVINTGEGALKVSEVSIISKPPGAFRLQAQAPLELPGEDEVLIHPATSQSNPRSMFVDVVVSRQEEGATPPTGVITVRSNSKWNDTEVITIPVETGGLASELTVEPKSVDFGNVGSGEIGAKQLNVINSGLGTLEISGFSLSGNPAFAFAHGGQEWSVTAETQGSGVTFDEPIVVEPGGSIQSTVRFQPEAPSPAEGDLVLFSNDPTQAQGTSVKLSGNQSGPCISINPKKVNFGGKLVGTVATVDVEILSCGEAPLRLRSVALDDTGSPDFGLDLGGLPGVDTGAEALTGQEDVCSSDADCAAGLVCDGSACAVELGINQSATFQVTYVPDEINGLDDNGQPTMDLSVIHFVSNAFVSELDVEVRGFGVEVECPTAVIQVVQGEEVIPQTKLDLIGSQSYASSGGISKYQWTVQQPVGSQSFFVPSAAAADPSFTVNAAGMYVFELRVWDDNNEESCIAAQQTVVVNPDEAIHVELLWDTPNDPDQTNIGFEAGADLDLHFMHWFAVGCDIDQDGAPDGWFDGVFDVFWYNDSPIWGSFDPWVDDDPGLDLDDTDGAGPENLNLNIPQDGGMYTVGVHYWNDHGFGPSTATVRIYIHGTLV
ncbi:MAG: choice-of-anchor D domain-containing protein, partial [Myxococcota bacterium]|nr:choice-of-anchor D domain-containing protein [Myxococcota bacterium]